MPLNNFIVKRVCRKKFIRHSHWRGKTSLGQMVLISFTSMEGGVYYLLSVCGCIHVYVPYVCMTCHCYTHECQVSTSDSLLTTSWGVTSHSSSSELPSIGTYFAEGSHQLGALSTELTPSQRVSSSCTTCESHYVFKGVLRMCMPIC